MFNAIKQALGLAPRTIQSPVTIPAYDPMHRPARHIKDGDRVIYRAGVCTDKAHPYEGKVGTVARIGEPNRRGGTVSGFYYVPVWVDWDDASLASADAYGYPGTFNSRNLITLTDWLVERELKRAA